MNALPASVDQLALFARRGAEIEQAFWEFHATNPQVYALLVRYARQAKAAGRPKFGIGMIWERLRWYTAVETTDATQFKLNNNHRSRYARLLMEQERCAPGCSGCDNPVCLADLFDTRELDQRSALEAA